MRIWNGIRILRHSIYYVQVGTAHGIIMKTPIKDLRNKKNCFLYCKYEAQEIIFIFTSILVYFYSYFETNKK